MMIFALTWPEVSLCLREEAGYLLCWLELELLVELLLLLLLLVGQLHPLQLLQQVIAELGSSLHTIVKSQN